MSRRLLVAGGGIGGLAAALAAARAGWAPHVLEQAGALSEVGAGLQLGPNATRVLRAWGLLESVAAHACAPRRLVARDARSGAELGALPLGAEFESRYGAPYLTVHRADLHAALLRAAQGQGVAVDTGWRIAAFEEMSEGVRVSGEGRGDAARGDALVGADGLWSVVRAQLLGDGPARPSDHVAYRGLLPIAAAPAAARAPEVTAWLGPRLHAVSYPVRGGEWLNVVCVVHQRVDGPRAGWDLPGTAEGLRAATGPVGGPLRELLDAVPAWGRWVLHDRDPVAGPAQMARGRVALLGDAAHPMRPYLAQGAAMAIEDALALGRALADAGDDVAAAFGVYAQARWQRAARVQRRSRRNATVFHASGPLRLARDLSLRAAGARVMDLPWLYG